MVVPASDAPTAGARPRRKSLGRSRSRPLVRRLFTVPTGQPSSRAAPSCVQSPRSHIVTTRRWRSGSLSTSSRTAASKSSPPASSTAMRREALSAWSRSCRLRRASFAREQDATRKATW
jgi:hypothetical protein